MDDEGLLSRAAVAVRLGVSERHVSNIESRGGLTAVRVGNRTLFRREDVDAYVRSCQTHRVRPDEDLDKFKVKHVERQQVESGRRRPRSFLLTPTTTNCNDQPLVLTEAQFGLLTKMANWDGSDLSQAEARFLLRQVEWVGEVLSLLRAGRGLTVQKQLDLGA